ncbi:hypothetical protein [Haliangium ochraceum]|uniref:Uncharacterized protein n=1 Tax=Haliangium ochraceum (strain DSM 14365 / JCM 11303 / SMP-2) TaxID=502025 RepID=D0LNU1_HALO1|nr:hypothetical protein [Haliangium ochraceum]ACY18767.1 hypothetical protein Hoch_6296 [Haliangium ochraceum DSM 14365]
MEEPRNDESAESSSADGKVFNWPVVLLFALVMAAALAFGFIAT